MKHPGDMNVGDLLDHLRGVIVRLNDVDQLGLQGCLFALAAGAACPGGLVGLCKHIKSYMKIQFQEMLDVLPAEWEE